jgi:hypothetical protein
MAINTDNGEQDTSLSSAPSLFNDTFPSLPQTPLLANSHFRQTLPMTYRLMLTLSRSRPQATGMTVSESTSWE